ncbi:MAG: hypothetical protein JW809_15430 [Pirellulales bacterium]|nr:hypothetical protein [Pirellulales bacterium]
MQLDRTQIEIRQRSFADVLDLALWVVRDHAGRLGLALVAGIGPLFALDHWLLSDMVDVEASAESLAGFWFSYAMLLAWQLPLATAPATLYLGGALFDDRPTAGRIARDLLHSAPQLVFYQVILRAMLVLPWVSWLWLFTQWTYLNEVVLLERNPFARRSREGPTTGRRCRSLHAGMGGELFARWIGSVLVGGVLMASIWMSLVTAHGVFSTGWEIDPVLFSTFYVELALWIVVGFLGVARFLGYLDLRIRREGWEVELLLRAEAARLRQTVASG